jgi:hypothetical protein
VRERCEVHKPSEFLEEDSVAAIMFGGVGLRNGQRRSGKKGGAVEFDGGAVQ